MLQAVCKAGAAPELRPTSERERKRERADVHNMTYNPDVHYMTLDAARSAASTVKPNTPAARKGGISEVATLSELRRSEKRGIQENQSSANPGQVKAPCSKQEGGDATKGDAWTPPFEMRQPMAVNETEARESGSCQRLQLG